MYRNDRVWCIAVEPTTILQSVVGAFKLGKQRGSRWERHSGPCRTRSFLTAGYSLPEITIRGAREKRPITIWQRIGYLTTCGKANAAHAFAILRVRAEIILIRPPSKNKNPSAWPISGHSVLPLLTFRRPKQVKVAGYEFGHDSLDLVSIQLSVFGACSIQKGAPFRFPMTLCYNPRLLAWQSAASCCCGLCHLQAPGPALNPRSITQCSNVHGLLFSSRWRWRQSLLAAVWVARSSLSPPPLAHPGPHSPPHPRARCRTPNSSKHLPGPKQRELRYQSHSQPIPLPSFLPKPPRRNRPPPRPSRPLLPLHLRSSTPIRRLTSAVVLAPITHASVACRRANVTRFLARIRPTTGGRSISTATRAG